MISASKRISKDAIVNRYRSVERKRELILPSEYGSSVFDQTIHRKASCPCGGGCPACQAKSSDLKISQPNDPAEIEADQIADRVMRMSIDDAKPKTNSSSASKTIHRKCDACEDEEEEVGESPVMRKEVFASVTPTPPPADTPPSIKNVINSGGQPLDVETRSFFEPRFGRDLGNVRLHTNDHAARSARDIGAKAYTVGSNISFAQGRYEPQTERGRQLLAHELAHVIQQQKSGQKGIQREEDDDTHILIFGGVPDFLNCERRDLDADSDTSCCSSHTLGLVPGYYREARSQTDQALTRIRSGANMEGAITRHFGSAALSHRSTIAANLQRIRDELDRESEHRILCRVARSGADSIGFDLMGRVDGRLLCDVGILASARADLSSRIITLCVNRRGVPTGGWVTLLHEVVHRSGVGDLPGTTATPAQIAAGEVETYEGGTGYPNPAPFSLRNADSYSNFVRDIGASGWTEESNLAAIAPRVEAGPALTLESAPRVGVMGGIYWTPFGSDIQAIIGARAMWFPRTDGETAAPTDLRAYAGAEIGLRWIVGGSSAQFVLDVAGGGGPYVRVDDSVDPALSARLGLGARFGGPQVGFGISADVMRLFHLNSGSLVGTEADDWFGGLMLRGHWGGTSSGTR